ncbi:MAG: type IV pilus twitching motility protein PilT [Anaerocolumna sp.]
MNTIELLTKAVKRKASDLHITSGVPGTVRVHGKLGFVDDVILKPADTKQIARELTSDVQWERLNKKGEVDFLYVIPGVQRFRVNAYRQRNTYSVALRLVNSEIPSFDDLGLPPIVKDLTKKNNGLILVTGPTGSGKSTTLASMLQEINETKDTHIITLEDPIEYLFKHKKSIVDQREIGSDTINFSNALRACLRQDPDVILVGEMRDFETISIALTAAETGHLVLSTLHTIGAASTIDRVIDVFPPHQQLQIRVQLALTLQGIISQQLLTKADNKGRIAALEIMTVNPAVRNLIREGKVYQLNNVIQTNAKSGMRMMDDALSELYKKGLITREDALSHCVEYDYLNKILM